MNALPPLKPAPDATLERAPPRPFVLFEDGRASDALLLFDAPEAIIAAVQKVRGR